MFNDISLNLSNDFDTIDHNIIINKLRNIGIRCVCLKLIKSYLFRKQLVIFNNSNSSLLPIQMGVFRGSVLGPMLFIIYI